ncbi:deaminated glutathione amidase [Gluconacetobacter tumulisoli]|uniref:Deaminated glutathione amidase n=1 Tax=Gluconacetobacter tumulisoli TaxID=1286189 RepID=A0A7W4K9F9_9PROT|nr:deaminated glutathione amidase [Gluconacetobacter tumulisoli]MBB2202790.1 deaminated glutathione amidase [Gluconacetobacter tumulisoli]
MKIALGQFGATAQWEENLATAIDLADRAAREGARLLILPEDILAADMHDPDIVLRTAQPLDGPFVTGLVDALRGSDLTVAGCIPVPDGNGRAHNCLIVVSGEGVVAVYRKLHLYDAFTMKESDRVTPGVEVPPLVTIGDLKIGLMTCYDVRFPELARSLALAGADVIALPAAWVRGPGKEWHWEVMVTARALENTCYVAAVGECGPRNIGCSMVVDPLGVAVVRAGQDPSLLFCEISKEKIAKSRQALPVLQNRRFAAPVLQ